MLPYWDVQDGFINCPAGKCGNALHRWCASNQKFRALSVDPVERGHLKAGPPRGPIAERQAFHFPQGEACSAVPYEIIPGFSLDDL
jgi:hypothetical protein